MKRSALLILWLVLPLVFIGCSDDDEVIAPPADVFEAYSDISNYLVGDGTVDTRMDVRLSASVRVAEDINPLNTRLDADLLLGSDQQTSPVEILLSNGDGTVLNEGQEFTMVADRRYLFMSMGDVSQATGATKPMLLQLNPLAKPGAGRVQFRFVNALVGNPIAVDVHVNDQVINNAAYGEASSPVRFDARPVGQDVLIVVPAGETPDGSNELYKSENQLLFVMDEHYDAVLTHQPSSIHDGDINGHPALKLNQSPY
jgi:hypothetical protein